jgi:hypothetical protein
MNFRLDPDCSAISAIEDASKPEFSDAFTREDFDREYTSACNLVLRELSRVGRVSLSIGEGDFIMYAGCTPPMRVITLGAGRPDAALPGYVPAAHAALQALPPGYSIVFEDEPAYVCVCRDGAVLGYCVEGTLEPLAAWGFPPDTV